MFIAPVPLFRKCAQVAHKERKRAPISHTSGARRKPMWTSSLVVVAGATGGVGQLVVSRLLTICRAHAEGQAGVTPTEGSEGARGVLKITHVKALVRNASRAHKVLPMENAHLSIAEIAVTHGADEGQAGARSYDDVLEEAAAVILCTGTTAFPTRAWKGGNTPGEVDDKFVQRIVSSVDKRTIKRVVQISSIGTHRTNMIPFSILNTFGILNAKRRGEDHVRREARQKRFAFSIVRPGRLVGGPQTNLGMLRSDARADWQHVTVARGDALIGVLSRQSTADAVVLATRWDTNEDLDFSVVHTQGRSPPAAREWHSLLQTVVVPQVAAPSAGASKPSL